VNLHTDAVRSAASGLRRGARPGRSALVAQGKTGQELNTRVGVDQDLLRGEFAGAAARAELVTERGHQSAGTSRRRESSASRHASTSPVFRAARPSSPRADRQRPPASRNRRSGPAPRARRSSSPATPFTLLPNLSTSARASSGQHDPETLADWFRLPAAAVSSPDDRRDYEWEYGLVSATCSSLHLASAWTRGRCRRFQPTAVCCRGSARTLKSRGRRFESCPANRNSPRSAGRAGSMRRA
jgi:hypothetical protein